MSKQSLPGNPHFEEGNHDNGSEQHALAQATLALAYEQRTANLIAFERTLCDAWRRDELKPEGVALWTKAANLITERLDLS